MKYLYYCNSPYQLMNVINLNWHRKHNDFENINNYCADVVILNAFDGAKEIVEILKKDKMFDSVKLSQRFKNEGLFHKFSTFLDFLIPKRYIEKSSGTKASDVRNTYDCLSMPKVSNYMLAMWILNKNAKIELFEEGFGTFCGGAHMCYEKSAHEWIYSLLNNGKKLINSYESIYINNKNLYLDTDIEKLISIPSIDRKCLDKIITLFKDILISNIDKDILWIGQYINDNVNNVMLKVLNSYSNNVVYLPHPRHKSNVKSNLSLIDSNKFWELNLNRIEDIDNKCFVTMHSTAAFSPKILYDKEPYLILTVNMIENKQIKEKCNFVIDIIEKFVNTYRDKSKIMLPKNEKELDECIKLYIQKANLV